MAVILLYVKGSSWWSSTCSSLPLSLLRRILYLIGMWSSLFVQRTGSLRFPWGTLCGEFLLVLSHLAHIVPLQQEAGGNVCLIHIYWGAITGITHQFSITAERYLSFLPLEVGYSAGVLGRIRFICSSSDHLVRSNCGGWFGLLAVSHFEEN